MKVKVLLEIFRRINWFKTIQFNLYYFNLRVALRFPILVYNRTSFRTLSGRITIRGAIKTGMIRLGGPRMGIQDIRYSRTIWQVEGGVEFDGPAFIGRGCKICVEKNAVLSYGEDFSCTGDTTFICTTRIKFGNDCLLSWDILFMDTDFHKIIDKNQRTVNPPKAICVGDHVWVGCRCTVLKGTSLPHNVVVAAGSIVSGQHDQNEVIYGGQGHEFGILKNEVRWTHLNFSYEQS